MQKHQEPEWSSRLWLFRVARVVAALAGLWICGSGALAQGRGDVSPGPEVGPEIEQSASITHLLRTADEAIGRSDWKLAIDSLQRVIDKPEGLLRAGTHDQVTVYESPRLHAQRLLAGLPPDGLAAYRVLYDGRAKGLLNQARRDFDLEALEHISNHYLVTDYGTQAAGLLASWLLDLGRESESLRVLDNLSMVYSESSPSGNNHDKERSGATLPVELELKRAVALALLGDGRSARSVLKHVLESLKASGGHGGSQERTYPKAVFEAVEAMVQQASLVKPTSRAPLKGWSGPGGGGSCNGIMDAVIPSFAENLPWRRPIRSSVVPGIWPDLDELGANMLPVTQPVAAEGRMFVKSDRECMAIDIQSFAILWTSPSFAEGIAERAAHRSSSSTGSERALLLDYVGGSLSTSHGLVLSVERGEPGHPFDSQGVVILRRGRTPSRNENPDYSNRLTAYDTRTGKVRWRRGQSQDADENLRQAQFLAPPIGIGDYLWVPFEASGDLYVGVLDPANGNLRQRILLCSLGGRQLRPTTALFPAAADGLVYIPTGEGLLFAVDVKGFSIAWATRYRSSPVPKMMRRRPVRPVRQRPPQWLSGPPVIAGRLVLLAPTDLDRLLAFDRVTGDLLWRLPRQRHRYIIAAQADRAWLGGEEVSAVSLWNASYEWTLPTLHATARAVLSGQTIYVPMPDKLLAIDAASGQEQEALDLPSDQPPLGNLLCIGGSMLSVDPSEVRAFPDRNSYAATLAAHRAHPSDVRIAIRMAFMELLENRPQRALDALAQAKPPPVRLETPDVDSQWAHVSHLRVRALMQLAKNRETPSDQAIGYLKQAVAAGRSDKDVVAARLALGHRLETLGRYAESYRTLWRLGQDRLGDEIIVSRKTRRPARLMIAESLDRIEPELAPTEIEDLSREASRLFESAVSQLETYPQADQGHPWLDGITILRRLADSGTLDGWRQRALNTLGRFELKRQKYERAEQYLNESLRCGKRRAETAQALLTLMDLDLERSERLDKSASDQAERLLREFGDVQLNGVPVATLVARRQAKIDPSSVAAHADALEVPKFEILSPQGHPKLAKALGQDMQLLDFRGRRTEGQAGRQLVFLPPRTLRSYRTEDGELEWESELLTEGDFAFGGDDQGAQDELVEGDLQLGLVDGQTLMLSGPRGLHAVGIVSGIRLWAQPVQGRVLLGDLMLRYRTMDALSGRVACVLSPGILSVRRVLDGKMIWERDLGETPAVVRIRDTFVLTADPKLEAVHVFRLSNGAALSDISFSQPDSTSAAVPIAYSQGVLCGPDDQGVSAYDVRTGDHLWSLALDEGDIVGQVFELNDGRFVIGTSNSDHRVVEARSGKVVLEKRLEDFPGASVYGTVESNMMILAGYEETIKGDRWKLVGIDMSTGQLRWSRAFIGVMNRSPLRLAKGVIPVVTNSRQNPQGVRPNAPRRYRQEVLLIDKQSGELVGDPLIFNGAARGGQLTGDLAVWPGRLLLQATKNIVVYTTRPLAVGSGGVN